MWLKIKPNDTLFFRTGRPFTMGDDTWADFLFPPYPSTLFGAIRSFYIFEKGSLEDFKNEKFKVEIGIPPKKGSSDEKGNLKIIGPFLYNENSNHIYFQPPLDLVKLKKENRDNQLYLLNLIEKPKLFHSDGYAFDKIFIFKEMEQVDEPEGWLNQTTFKDYLLRKKDAFNFIEDKEIFEKELKIGIARDRKKFTSREGHLYRIPMIRLKKEYSFLIKIEGLNDIPKSGILQVGGEGKTAVYEELNINPVENLDSIEFELKNNMFKIYLATPSIFNKGWIPDWIDENNLQGEKDGIKLKLIACVIGKYLRIGGWDMANNCPKQMRKAVPSGSVYYFKVLNNVDSEKIKEVFHLKNISEINSEEGFGLSLIGVV